MTDVLDLVATLRPDMTKRELDAIVEQSRGALSMGGVLTWRTIELTKKYKNAFHVMLDAEDSVVRVTFGDPMDRSVMGLRIGMPLIDAQKAMPAEPMSVNPQVKENGISIYRTSVGPTRMVIGYAVKDDHVKGIHLVAADSDARLAILRQKQEARKAARRRERELKASWKTICEPNEMLRTWARHHSSWNEPSGYWMRLANWLIEDAKLEDRHIFVQIWNWDHGIAPLVWLIRQPNTDLATIFSILHGAEPAYYLQYEGVRERVGEIHLDIFDMIIEIKQKVETGFYRNFKFAFTPPKLRLVENQEAQLQYVFPDDSLRAAKGKNVTNQTYSCRLPVDVS